MLGRHETLLSRLFKVEKLQFLIFRDKNTLTIDAGKLEVAEGIVPRGSIYVEIESRRKIFVLNWVEAIQVHESQIEVGCGNTLGC